MKIDSVADNLDALIDRLISKELQCINIENKAVMLLVQGV